MSRKGWVLFAIMCVVWGIPYLLIKVADGGVSVPVIVFARTGLGALVLLPPALWSRGLGALRHRWRPLAAFAVLEIIAAWGLLSLAEHRLSSSLTGLLIAAVPIVGVVLARVTGGTERLSLRRWAGLLAGLAGVAVLAAPTLAGGSGWAVGEVLLVVACYATSPIIAARKLADVPALPMTAACLTAAALVYAPAAALTWPRHVPSARVLAALAALGIVCTALAFLVFLRLIKEAGPTRALVFTYVNPAVAVAAGVTVLGEPFTATTGISFALIIAGCVLATASERPASERSAAGRPPEVPEPDRERTPS
ncbi:MAG: DMT family transporter [Nocardiopsaceae bacterium]|nr:DMT family transporter [Nocardiopsaceae bacterium]